MRNGFTLHDSIMPWYLTIPAFDNTGIVKTAFSTRVIEDNTDEVSRKELLFNLCKVIDIDVDNMVLSDQVHDDKIAVVDINDRGKGVIKPSDIKGIDGLITDASNVALVTFYADCVPLYFLDTKNRAIGLTHSGWRGTVAQIGAKTLQKMKKVYNTQPEDCFVAIGPSIGQCCFEVDDPVAQKFYDVYGKNKKIIIDAQNGKYYIDLWQANKIQFINEGIPEENITVAGLCTRCRQDLFYSYRGSRGCKGRMAAVLILV